MKGITLVVLGVLLLLALVARFVKQVRRIRETKARVRLAHRKWLLERAKEEGQLKYDEMERRHEQSLDDAEEKDAEKRAKEER